jgi:hypothetical protein
MPLLRHHKGMKIVANDVVFRRGGFAPKGLPLVANPPLRKATSFATKIFIPLWWHGSGMGNSLENRFRTWRCHVPTTGSRRDTAVPCPGGLANPAPTDNCEIFCPPAEMP